MEFWPAAIVAVILVGVSKGGFGSGIGVAATPIIALTISAADAAALLLPLLIVADTFAVRQYHRRFDRANLMQLTTFMVPNKEAIAGFFQSQGPSLNQYFLKNLAPFSDTFSIRAVGEINEVSVTIRAVVKNTAAGQEILYWRVM